MAFRDRSIMFKHGMSAMAMGGFAFSTLRLLRLLMKLWDADMVILLAIIERPKWKSYKSRRDPEITGWSSQAAM